jgi:hypothetical protein
VSEAVEVHSDFGSKFNLNSVNQSNLQNIDLCAVLKLGKAINALADLDTRIQTNGR